ncbi:MAG: mechanosensitive ion channel family protein [Dehalococcoidia bacterium]
MEWFMDHGIRMLAIAGGTVILYLLLRWLVAPALQRTVASSMRGEQEGEIKKRADTLSRVLLLTSRIALVTVAIFMILSEAGVNIAPALVGFGIAGIAIGFGAQNLVRDIIGGLFVVVENQYRVGDVVRLGGIAGIVEDINLRRTLLRDLDGIQHVVPNGETGVASNFTKGWSRVNMNISVAYGEDLDRVIEVINRVGRELAEDKEWGKRILTPPQVLRVDNLGDSGIDIKILGDTKPIEQWGVMGELRLRLKRTFDQEGIEIPWPHTKLYFGNAMPKQEG